MKKEEIEEKIKEILQKNHIIQGIPIAKVKSTDNLIENLGVDSAGMVKGLTAIEKAFEIEISSEDFTLENFATIDLIVKYISKRLEG